LIECELKCDPSGHTFCLWVSALTATRMRAASMEG
jgi:hypothetical protein